jgi:hypothetical protein
MAGTKTGDFVELISPFLRRKMSELEIAHGMNSAEWRAIALQYVKNPVEAAISPQERRRHYESEITIQFNGQPPHRTARTDHGVRRALPLVPARPVSGEDPVRG